MPSSPDRTAATLAGPLAGPVADLMAVTLRDAARGRTRTARLVQAAGPGAWQEILVMGALTGVAALLLIRLF